MALKGKSKKSSGSNRKQVARAPRSTLEKRSPKRNRRRVDVFMILGGLTVLAVVLVVGYGLFSMATTETTPGLGDFVKKTGSIREDLDNIADELRDRLETAKGGGQDAAAAYGAADDLARRAEANAKSFRDTPKQSGVSLTAETYTASAQLFAESGRLLKLAGGAAPPELQAQLVKKGMRVYRDADTTLRAASDSLKVLQTDGTFAAQQAFFAVPDPQLAEGPPLLGVPPEASDFTVTYDVRKTQPDPEWARTVATIMTSLDDKLKNSPEVMTQYDASKDAGQLQANARSWFDATRTAIERTARERTPDTLQLAMVVVANEQWVLLESNRSFASVAQVPSVAQGLVDSGKRLRLIADTMQAAASGAILKVAPNSGFPEAPASGFDPSLIGAAPSAPGGQSSPLGAPGAPVVPPGGAGGVPGGLPGGAPGGLPGGAPVGAPPGAPGKP